MHTGSCLLQSNTSTKRIYGTTVPGYQVWLEDRRTCRIIASQFLLTKEKSSSSRYSPLFSCLVIYWHQMYGSVVADKTTEITERRYKDNKEDRKIQNRMTMKIVIAWFSLAALVGSTVAWVSIPEPIHKAFSIASMAAVLTTGPLHTNAVVDFSGSYADPNHPNCQRVIAVAGPDATLSGTDGNPGCPPDGSGKAWKLLGKVDGSTIFVDFSPKGGPPALKGVWDTNAPVGIQWPDGNKWTLKGN